MKLIMPRFVLLVLALSVSQSVFANQRYWGELGVGAPGFSLHARLKYVENDRGWTASYSTISQNFILETIRDRETGDSIDPYIHLLSVLKTRSRSGNSWHLDAGLGLGFAAGRWGDNCVRVENTGFTSREDCEIDKVGDIGLPLYLSAAAGRRLGLGIEATLFLTESRPYGSVGVFMLFGKFPK